MSTPVLYVNPSDCIAVRDLEKHSMVIEYACILSEPHEYTCTICEPQWLCLAGFGTVCCQRPRETHHGHWVHQYFVLQGLGLYAARDLEKHTMIIGYACTLCEPHEYTCTLCEPQWLCLAGFGTVCCQRPGETHYGHWVCLYFVWTPWVHLYLMWTPMTVSCSVWDCMQPETWRNTPWSLNTPTLCVNPMSTPVPYVNPSGRVLGLYAPRDLEKHTMVIEYACTLSCRVWDCMLPETWRNTPWSLSTSVTWSATRRPTEGRRNMMTRYASALVSHPLLLCSGCLSVGGWLYCLQQCKRYFV